MDNDMVRLHDAKVCLGLGDAVCVHPGSCVELLAGMVKSRDEHLETICNEYALALSRKDTEIREVQDESLRDSEIANSYIKHIREKQAAAEQRNAENQAVIEKKDKALKELDITIGALTVPDGEFHPPITNGPELRELHFAWKAMPDALQASGHKALREVEAKVWDEAAIEAGKKRLVFFTDKDILEILDDSMTMKVRAQMRKEIVDACLTRAAVLREPTKDSGEEPNP